MNELTQVEALEYYESGEWRSMTNDQLAIFQLDQPRVCVPWDVFRAALESSMDRPVFDFELLDKEKLKSELTERIKRRNQDGEKTEIPWLDYPENHPHFGQAVEVLTHSQKAGTDKPLLAIFTFPHWRFAFVTENFGWETGEIVKWRPMDPKGADNGN